MIHFFRILYNFVRNCINSIPKYTFFICQKCKRYCLILTKYYCHELLDEIKKSYAINKYGNDIVADQKI